METMEDLLKTIERGSSLEQEQCNRFIASGIVRRVVDTMALPEGHAEDEKKKALYILQCWLSLRIPTFVSAVRAHAISEGAVLHVMALLEKKGFHAEALDVLWELAAGLDDGGIDASKVSLSSLVMRVVDLMAVEEALGSRCASVLYRMASVSDASKGLILESGAIPRLAEMLRQDKTPVVVMTLLELLTTDRLVDRHARGICAVKGAVTSLVEMLSDHPTPSERTDVRRRLALRLVYTILPYSATALVASGVIPPLLRLLCYRSTMARETEEKGVSWVVKISGQKQSLTEQELLHVYAMWTLDVLAKDSKRARAEFRRTITRALVLAAAANDESSKERPVQLIAFLAGVGGFFKDVIVEESGVGVLESRARTTPAAAADAGEVQFAEDALTLLRESGCCCSVLQRLSVLAVAADEAAAVGPAGTARHNGT